MSNRLPEPRFSCAYTSLGEDRHLVIGGRGFRGDGCSYDTKTVFEYNSTMKLISSHTPLPKERSGFAAITIDNQHLLVVGGKTARNGVTNAYDSSCCVYDTKTREWSDGPQLKIGRAHHTCVTAKSKVYALGGWVGGNRSLDFVEVLDLSLPLPSWRILPQRLGKKRMGCQAVVDPKNPNNIIVVGGFNSTYLRCCEVVSLQEGQEEQTRTIPSLMTPRCGHAMVLVENRFLVVMGGRNGCVGYLSSVEVLDLDEAPEQQQWHPLPSMSTGRFQFAAFYSPRNRKIVVAGGRGFNGTIDVIEEMEVKVDQEQGRSGVALTTSGPPCQHLPKPPSWGEIPSGCLDANHQMRIKAWIEKGKEEQSKFVSAIDVREREIDAQITGLRLEREENRRAAGRCVSDVRKQQQKARAIVAFMQDLSSGTEDCEPASLAALTSDVETAQEEVEELQRKVRDSCGGVLSGDGDPGYVYVGEDSHGGREREKRIVEAQDGNERKKARSV